LELQVRELERRLIGSDGAGGVAPQEKAEAVRGRRHRQHLAAEPLQELPRHLPAGVVAVQEQDPQPVEVVLRRHRGRRRRGDPEPATGAVEAAA
jgi:hypothetical protein